MGRTGRTGTIGLAGGGNTAAAATHTKTTSKAGCETEVWTLVTNQSLVERAVYNLRIYSVVQKFMQLALNYSIQHLTYLPYGAPITKSVKDKLDVCISCPPTNKHDVDFNPPPATRLILFLSLLYCPCLHPCYPLSTLCHSRLLPMQPQLCLPFLCRQAFPRWSPFQAHAACHWLPSCRPWTLWACAS